MQTRELFIICDGIQNSVFKSQVLAPILQQLEQDPLKEISLISFELSRPDNTTLTACIPAHPRLHAVMFQRPPFFGKTSLLFCVQYLKKLLQGMPPVNKITARGALAGYIATQTLKSVLYQDFHLSLVIQARGLHAEEYRYALSATKVPFYKKLLAHWIYSRLINVEHAVYSTTNSPLDYDLTIEAVSPALKEYIIEHFYADPAKVTVATRDIPEKLTPEAVAQYRQEIRTKLGIKPETVVYCYSGSYKPWQCAPETIDYFAQEYAKNNNSFLLILSQDKHAFEIACEQRNIPKNTYIVLSVTQDQLYAYLACADYGFLLRKKDIINWVSRPTKMLEYQAVGLTIIHNDTIAELTKN